MFGLLSRKRSGFRAEYDRDVEQNLLLVKGAVPGHKNGYVVIREDKR